MPQTYVKWTPIPGGEKLQYWDKTLFSWQDVEGKDFNSGLLRIMYKSDPNYRALYEDLGDNSFDISQSGSGANSDPFGGLLTFNGGANTNTPAQKRKGMLNLFLLIGAVAIVAYFIYKYFKK